MLRRLSRILLCFCLIFHSCARVDNPEKDLLMTPGNTEYYFTAEFTDNKSDSTAVVVVMSNRSWYAVLNDLDHPIDPADEGQRVSWGVLDVYGHTNLSHMTDTVELHVTVNRNKSQIPVNGVIDFYADGGKAASISLKQMGAVYHLDAVPEKLHADCMPDRIRVSVDCNTEWSAVITDATAEAELSVTSGYDPGSFEIIFDENGDVTEEKTATVKISAKDCPDKILAFTQEKAEPYIAWAEEQSPKLHAWEQTGKLVFRTNCAWTLETEESGLTNVLPDKTSGDADIKGNQEINFSFTNTLSDPQTPATATFILKTDYTDPITITVSQRPQLVINLASQTPFTPSLPEASSTTETTHAFTYDGHEYSISLLLPYFQKNKVRFYGHNGTINGYIKFPAIENATMSAVEIYLKADGTYYKMNAAVFSDDGEEQMSDAFTYATASTAVTHNFILGENGTSPIEGKAYMLKGLAKLTCCINKIVVSYE